MHTHIHGHVCNTVHLKKFEILKSSVFDRGGGGESFQYFSEPKNVSSDDSAMVTAFFLSWVTTLDSKIHCHVYPLDNNYSYNTWFKSTLHSLVTYAQHSESIYFPIYV